MLRLNVHIHSDFNQFQIHRILVIFKVGNMKKNFFT